MEKRIIKSILESGEFKELDVKDMTYLDIDFAKAYGTIRQLHDNGHPINVNTFNVYNQVNGFKYDIDNVEPIDGDIVVALQKINKDRSVELEKQRIKKLADAGEFDKISESITRLQKSSFASVLDFSKLFDTQKAFIDRIKQGLPVDGLYLYNGKEYNNRQFIKFSYLIKYFGKSDYVVISGRPSVGKSSFVLSLANVLAKYGKRGLIFSLEMTNDQLIHRMAIAKSGITNSKLFDTVDRLSEQDYNRYVSGLYEVSQLPLLVVDKPPRDWYSMKQIILEKKDEIDFVVIDHLALIGSFYPDDRESNNTLITNRVSRDIKSLANAIEKPFFVLAQPNRGVGGDKNRGKDLRYQELYMNDLRDSGAIEEDADKIIFLYRHGDPASQVVKDKEKIGRHDIVVKLDKNKEGSLGSVLYEFNASLNRWKELEKE